MGVTGVSPKALWSFRLFLGACNAQFTRAVFVLFLVAQGHSLFVIGLLEGCFHLARVIGEIPLGAMADRFGRRPVIVGGLLASAVGTALMAVDQPVVLVVSFLLQGAGWAAQRGADSALLYELLAAAGQQHRHAREYGRAVGLHYATLAVCTIVGGWMYEALWWLPFAVQTVCTAGAALFVFSVPEMREPTEESEPFGRTVAAGLKILADLPMLRYLLIFLTVVEAGVTVISIFSQDYFDEIGFSARTISLILGLVTLLGAAASVVAHRLAGVGATLTMAVAAAAFLAGIGGLLQGGAILAVLGFYAVFLTLDLLEPVLNQFFNDAVDDARRATVLSFQSFLGSVMTVLAFVLSGAAVDASGYPLVLGTLLVVSLPIFGILLLRSRRNALMPGGVVMAGSSARSPEPSQGLGRSAD